MLLLGIVTTSFDYPCNSLYYIFVKDISEGQMGLDGEDTQVSVSLRCVLSSCAFLKS